MNIMDNSSYSERTVEYSLELMRQDIEKNKKNMGMVFGVAVAMFAGMYVLNPLLRRNNIEILVFPLGCILVIATLIMTGRIHSKTRQYRHLYKQELVEKVLKEEFNNVFYVYDMGFMEKEIREKAFVKMGNKFSSEDYLRAEYHGVNFVRSDVEVKYVTHSKNHTHTETYFKGRVYELEFNKTISAGLQIRTRNFPYAQMPQYLNKNGRIQTENVVFNQMFDVFATNDAAAFYVLTPHMMEHIIKLSSSFKSICINILGNKMVLAANSDLDGLEPPTREPIDYYREKKRILAELTEIMAIIDELGLDDKTFADSTYNSLSSHMQEDKQVDNKTMEDMFLGNIG